MLKRTLLGLFWALAFMATAPALAAEHHYTFTGQATPGPTSEWYGSPEAITGAISGTFAYDAPSLPTLGLRETTHSLPDGSSVTTLIECCAELDGGNYGPLSGRDFGLLTWSLTWATGTDYREINFEGQGGWIERTLLANGSSTLSIASSAPPVGRDPDDQTFHITFFSDSDALYQSRGEIPLNAVTSIQGDYLKYVEMTGEFRNFTFVANVAPAVPEPSAWVLVFVGLAALSARVLIRNDGRARCT